MKFDRHPSYDRVGATARMSVAVAMLVTGLKALSYGVSGSVALYSDAVEGGVNIVSALVVLMAVAYAQRPADEDHPFGHHKAEYLATGFEGGLIAIAAVLILDQAFRALYAPPDLSSLGLAALISALATVVNAGWGWYLVTRGTMWNSPALRADGLHVLTDVWTSIGVLTGLYLVWLTGAKWIDTLMAALVAAYILWTGYQLVRGSLGGLLDGAVPAEVVANIEATVRGSGAGALQAHDIRTRMSGRVTFIEFHLVVPGDMTVRDAHAICDRIEAALEARIPGVDISIHIEPSEAAKDGNGAVAIKP